MLAANIAKVNGLVFSTAPAFTGLLDTYTGAAAAYSVRQLKTGVTIAMRVRRDTNLTAGDDDEADVAFDTSLTDPAISLDSAISNASAGVNALTLGEFLNVGTVGGKSYVNRDNLTVTASCFVDEWKDQTTNANHATQGTFGAQPQIHLGTVNTDLITENGKPAIEWDGSDDIHLDTGTVTTVSQPYFITCVYNTVKAAGTQRVYSSSSTSLTPTLTANVSSNIHEFYAGTAITGGAVNTNQRLATALYEGTSSLGWVDGTQVASGNASTGSFTGFWLGKLNAAVSFQNLFGTLQEVILWDSDDTNRTGIETNIDNYFQIPGM